MSWKYGKIRREAWDAAFGKGVRSWGALVTVCFIFSFLGVANASQTSFIDTVDRMLGGNDAMLPANVEILESYVADNEFLAMLPLPSDVVRASIDSLTKRGTWVIRLLALNPAYFERNPGEVLANVIVVALASMALKFLVQNVAILGRHRYAMENRFARKVPLRRTVAPFHLTTLGNVVKVMFLYNLMLLVWTPTVIGYFYKSYQYRMVPYLLAENPSAGYRDVFRLSREMTDGHKWHMFLTHVSYAYIWVLQTIPVAGLLVALPLGVTLDAEMYFVLRRRDDIDRSLFVEKAFGGSSYAKRKRVTGKENARLEAPSSTTYKLRDIDVELPERTELGLPYPIVDLVMMFFVFCFVGWVWEVGLHYLQEHTLANRGTMYGPWLPIYGSGGILMIVLLDRYKGRVDAFFGRAVLLSAVLEYVCSFLLEFMFDTSYWDYRQMLLNVNGRICIAGMIAFGIGGLFGVYLAAPLLERALGHLTERQKRVLACVLVVAFACDLVACMVFGFNSGAGVTEPL